MEWGIAGLAIVMLVTGLIGQAFEMRKLRDTTAPQNVFMHRRNFKWYAIIAASIVLWYVAERL